MELQQKKNFTTTKYNLEADHISLEVKTPWSRVRTRLPFGYITEDNYESWAYSKRWFGAWVFFSVVFILLQTIVGTSLNTPLQNLSELTFVVWNISLVGLLFSIRPIIGFYCTDGNSLSFIRKKTKDRALEKFIQIFLLRRREFLELQYSSGGAEVRYSLSMELQRLHSLMNQGVISELEFSDIKRRMILDEQEPGSDIDDFLRGGEDLF